MTELAEMIARVAQAGHVHWIGVRPERRADLKALDEVSIEPNGLAGDHGRAGKRAVTLVQAEHLSAIGSYLGCTAVSPFDMRRNLVVSGINLSSLKGRRILAGTAQLDITTICAPCSRMEENFGHGGYAAVRGHGGWCAQVVEAGHVRIGDVISVLE